MRVLKNRDARYRVNPFCVEPFDKVNKATQGMTEELKEVVVRHGFEFQTYKGAGCEACDHTGYKGRTGIFELMLMNDDLRRLIIEKKGTNILRQRAIEHGMVSLREDGLEKVRQGVCTIEEVARVTIEEG